MSGKRSSQNSCRLGKQTLSSSTKTKFKFSVSHEDHLLQENHPAQHLRFSSQVCLSAILKYVATNILELVGNEAHNDCRVQRAVNNNMQSSHLFEDDTTSQVSEMF